MIIINAVTNINFTLVINLLRKYPNAVFVSITSAVLAIIFLLYLTICINFFKVNSLKTIFDSNSFDKINKLYSKYCKKCQFASLSSNFCCFFRWAFYNILLLFLIFIFILYIFFNFWKYLLFLQQFFYIDQFKLIYPSTLIEFHDTATLIDQNYHYLTLYMLFHFIEHFIILI